MNNGKPPQTLDFLIRLMAQADALHVPLRDPSSPNWAAVCVRRRAYQARGVECSVGGTDADRKAGERSLKRMASARLLQTFRAGGKVASVRLTPRGDAVGRSLCGLSGMVETVDLLKAMHELRDDPDASAPGSCSGHLDSRPWLAETMFTPDRKGWGDCSPGDAVEWLAAVQKSMRCGLAAGFLVSNSDSRRHVRYRLTETGLAVATGELLPTIFDATEPEEWAGESYLDHFYRELDALRAKADAENEIGMIPLPASLLTRGAARQLAQ